MRLFFASDLHGSEPCFKKFVNAAAFYDASVLVMGGDLTGKAILPIVEQGRGIYRTEFMGRNYVLRHPDELNELEQNVRKVGFYPRRVMPHEASRMKEDPDALDEAFSAAIHDFFREWIAFAEERLPKGVECYVMAGNDDSPAVVEALNNGERVRYVEGKKVTVAGAYEMINVGYSNRTPFHSPREVGEEELGCMVERLASEVASAETAIFNIHVPPSGTRLDLAPEIDEEFRIKTRLGHPNMVHVVE